MHKCGRDQDASAEMLGTEEEGWWDAKARKLGDEDGKSTAGRRYEQDDEQTADMECKVVVRLCGASFTSISPREAVNRDIICIVSAEPSTLCLSLRAFTASNAADGVLLLAKRIVCMFPLMKEIKSEVARTDDSHTAQLSKRPVSCSLLKGVVGWVQNPVVALA
jgi:hypothetical protein